MRTNGTLQYKVITGGGINSNGDNTPATATWSEPIDCLIIPNSGGRIQKYQDGNMVDAAYQVHLEHPREFNYSTIRITTDRAEDLGEFQVLKPNIQHLDVAGRINIIV